ncbi:hypothetical protein D3P09_02400 [Paenibacillus pinisoli]|uniref:Uncharacterized protein n=1 Tax=Paenibacillus pinisoli TaxID=1276110 RepID=A0A3A6PGE0_9BACL|nr:hypothetical protein [Paenibacillus pinisoli]RJX40892.1 hypothetical protein D3P09_02400 [Paenibacillus pinisoli]
MANMSGNKQINRLHLIYISVCFGIVVISILTVTIWHGEGAGTGLNNAATASSIVLAVVAIVMTIVDIAGQRNTIADLKETAKALEENLNKTNKSLEMVSTLESRLENSMNSLQKNHEELSRSISELQHRYESKGEDRIVEELEKLKKNISNSMPSQSTNSKELNDLRINSERQRQIRKAVRSFLEDKEGSSFSEILVSQELSEISAIPTELKAAMKYLLRIGGVIVSNGKYSIRN